MSAELALRWRIHAGVTVALVPPALSLISFARMSRWLGGGIPPEAGLPSFEDRAIAEWVDRLLYALPRPWHHSCLKRSAVLYHLLRRDGRAVELCIGVRRDAAGALTAHAWLLWAGLPYLEPSHAAPEAYRVIARFPEVQPRAS
jgi:hypothetical protein